MKDTTKALLAYTGHRRWVPGGKRGRKAQAARLREMRNINPATWKTHVANTIKYGTEKLEREAYRAKPIVLHTTKQGHYWLGREGDKPPTELFTVYTKDSSYGRGDYAEEIDVLVRKRSVANAKKVAQAAIDRDYQDDLKPSKAVYRVAGFMFM